jgi:WD40 repeat protein
MPLSEVSVPKATPYREDERPKFPYPGLRPFKMSEAEIFYGRNAQKDSVLERLNEHRMVFITGPSGCGKSSLVKAGVIPALRAGLLTRAGYRWKTTEMRAGQQPLVNLARALEDAFGAGTSGSKPSGNGFRSLLERDEAGLWAVMDQAENLRSADSHALLLLVDQFEEIFGPQIKDLPEVDAFVRLLVTQYARPHPSLYVVFTIRSDYLGQCASFPGLSDAINHCQYLTPALTASELRQAIVRPGEDYGAHVSEDLVDDILTDMRLGTAYDADNLPLMQHALLFLWQKATESGLPGTTGPDATSAITLDASGYRKLGGLRSILDRHANAIFVDAAGPGGERAAIAEALFRRLSERDSEGRYRRSPASFDEVKEIASCSEAELKQVIGPFAHEKVSFLEIRDENLLDISHEALIRTWGKGRAWADQEAEKILTFRQLLRSATEWQDELENPDLLKHRPDLDVLQGWWLQSVPTVSWGKRYFDQQGGVVGAAAAITLVERYLDASREADRREKRKYRWLMLGLGGLAALIIAGVPASLVWIKSREDLIKAGFAQSLAQKEAEHAKSELRLQWAKTIAVKAEDALEHEGPAKAILLAMEAQKQELPDLPETEQVIFKSLHMPIERRIISVPGVMGLAYSADGKAIAGMDSSSLYFWNPEDGNLIDKPYSLNGKITPSWGRIQWSPAGEWIAIGSQDQILLVAPCSRSKLKALFRCGEENEDRKKVIGGDHGPRASLAKFSEDGRWIVTSAFGGAPLTRWDLANAGAAAGKISLNVALSLPNAFAISPDMTRVAAGLQNGEIRMIDPNSGKVMQPALQPPPEGHSGVNALSFNPHDPNMLVASEVGGSIFVWDVENKKSEKLSDPQGTVWQLTFSRDGKFVAAATDTGLIRTWETQHLAKGSVFRGHKGPVTSIAYSPDRESLGSASISDKTIRIWNLDSPLHEETDATPQDSRSAGPQSSDAPPDCTEGISLPPGFGPIAACKQSETGRRVVASKKGRLALFNVREGWSEPIDDWHSPADVASIELEHDRIVAVLSSGSRVSWPFFKDISSLTRFAADHIPFEGKSRMSLPDEVRCKLAPPDNPCKAKPEQVQE